MSKWRVEEVPALKGYTVEWAEAGEYYLSKRNTIFRSEDLSLPFETVAKIGAPAWKEKASLSRLAQRLLRFQVTNVIPLSNGDLFVTFDKSVGIIRKGAYTPLDGLKRPARVLRSACGTDKSGKVYFGEYLANDDRGEMSVYEYSTGAATLEIAYTFPAGTIKHIHGLYFDEFTNAIFCLTGDVDAECRILRSFDGCRTFETVGEGDESWRAVSLQFDADSLFYGTDAEFRANHIYKVDRNTLEREQIGEVSGTVFYSKKVGDDIFFATTAENAPSQKENVAAIFHLAADGVLSELASFRKDRWHPTYFQFGTIHFPAFSHSQTELHFHLVGVEEDDRVFSICRND
ncbi:MAG: hypothetical protein OEQ28_16890 [Acidobacteriota bacterium]|nr:hypothetical protein [Acidobacteriota bacterium]